MIAAVLAAPTAAKIPTDVDLSPVVAKLLDDPVTTEAQRQKLAIFHGQWNRLDQPTPTQRAAVALASYQLDDPVLSDVAVPVLIRAQAAAARGEPEAAVDLLSDDTSAPAVVVLAGALEALGRVPDAVDTLTPLRQRPQQEQITDPAELTAIAQAIIMLARFEGRPAQDYGLAMSLLGKARTELDPLYWPAYVAEARVLIDKDNAPEAANALLEALRLNPRSATAWHMLGQIAVNGYDFATAERCAAKLRRINPTHLLADLLDAESFLTQKDTAAALAVIEPALGAYPHHRQLLAFLATAQALAFQQDALQDTLDQFDALSPGNARAYFTVGRFLSKARQYPAGEAALRTAINRVGNWPQPRIELGLLLMQAGDESAALVELSHAARLDPFNRRANNQLKLAQELATYDHIRTEHFLIRYQPGIDEALAQDMPKQLEQVYRHITGVFGYQPTRPTIIEIMPDEQRFAVRITGIADIWTIAACTGDVIALTPPRSGASQRGAFDWARVIQHEYVHTVTLNQTNFRVPHWFTEGCAVSQEPGDRAYQECLLLAAACAADKLFDLDQINWAFVRPKTPRDRPLAYAQASWMIEYITTRFGHDAVIKLLDQFRDGATEPQAILAVTAQNADQFIAEFKSWATDQTRQWGLYPQPQDPEIEKLISSDPPYDQRTLQSLLARHPDHPDLLRLKSEIAVENNDPASARQAVLRYAAVRPIDPWSDKQLVKLSLRSGSPHEAVIWLEQLDRRDTQTGQWAQQLAQIHRDAGRFDLAADAMTRALHRQPYNATYRESAAAIALQTGDPPTALHHLKALALIEPDRAIHYVRLAALYAKMGLHDDARTAATHARQINPRAPVDRFLSPGD